MKDHPVLMYALVTSVALAGVVALTLALPVSGPDTRRGVVMAALLAWPVQVALFGARETNMRGGPRFFAMWLLGTLARFALLGVGALIASGQPGLAPPLLMGLAGMLFLMLLLEGPVRARTTPVAHGAEIG